MKTVAAIFVVLVAAFPCALGAEYKHFDNTDCSGGDIQSFKPTSLENCKAQCSQRQECKSFQFNIVNECYLKSHACSQGELVSTTSGNIYNKEEYTHFDNSDCSGYDIDSIKPTSLENCKAQCDQRQNCRSFQFNVVNECYLKSYPCSQGELVSTTSGNIYNKGGSGIRDWMNDIDGNEKLKDLAIPGTHDSGAYRIPTNIGEAQDWDIEQQLNAGIRFLDIRLSNGGGNHDFEVRHGFLKLGSFREKVMNVVSTFLRRHPSETILMSIKNEKSFDISRMESLFVQESSFLFYQGSVTANTKLNTVRGKIVLIKRYSETSYSRNIGINWDQLHVQDEYKLGGNFFAVKYDKKAEIVLNHFNAAAVSTNGKIWVNFASANWNGIKIGNNAKVANKAVNDFYRGTNQRVGSIVPMDYPNRENGVIEVIIKNNFK